MLHAYARCVHTYITCSQTLHAYVCFMHAYITWVLVKKVGFKAQYIEIKKIAIK